MKSIVNVYNAKANVKHVQIPHQIVSFVPKVDKLIHLLVHALLIIQKLIINVSNVMINVMIVAKVLMIVSPVLKIATEHLPQIVFVNKDFMILKLMDLVQNVTRTVKLVLMLIHVLNVQKTPLELMPLTVIVKKAISLPMKK